VNAGHDSQHQKGLLITAFGGIVLTIDIPLIRLAHGDPWSILLMRSGLSFLSGLTAWYFIRLFTRRRPVLVPGRAGFVVALLYALTSMTFLAAVYNTPTANLVFILAFNPMFAAILSWIFIKEPPRPVTVAAMVLMLGGVLIIVNDGISAGHLAGDLLALCSAFLLAIAITITRASGHDMGFAPIVANIMPFAVAAVAVLQTGLDIEVPIWIIINGAIVMPVSFFCLAIGPKYISGPEVAMFYLLETVFAPIWVWMIFSEVPSNQTMLGGGILLTTLLAHSIWQLSQIQKRRRAAIAVRHPL
jgi:drug/metabolite transporter (DMT)-like permease